MTRYDWPCHAVLVAKVLAASIPVIILIMFAAIWFYHEPHVHEGEHSVDAHLEGMGDRERRR